MTLQHKKIALYVLAGIIVLAGVIALISRDSTTVVNTDSAIVEITDGTDATSTGTDTPATVKPAVKPKPPIKGAATKPAPVQELTGTPLGTTLSIYDVSLTPVEVVEDSRCPTGVQCIQAGRIRVKTMISNGTKTVERIFQLHDPITFDNIAFTMTVASPEKKADIVTKATDYRFVFVAQKLDVTYIGTSVSEITVTSPTPGMLVNRQFQVTGEVKSSWYKEGAFPILIVDKEGNNIGSALARATREWRTYGNVPFSADLAIVGDYAGPIAIIFRHGEQADVMMSVPVTVK
jgi:hypothetical protein